MPKIREATYNQPETKETKSLSDKKTHINVNPEFELIVEQQEKFEEIKRMTWEMYKAASCLELPDDLKQLKPKERLQNALIDVCWDKATYFYNFAKQKEGEINNE